VHATDPQPQRLQEGRCELLSRTFPILLPMTAYSLRFVGAMMALVSTAVCLVAQTSISGRITNVSALVQIPSGRGALSQALGFTTGSSSPLLVRGVGPTLAKFGVTNTAIAPVIQYYAGSGSVSFGGRIAIAFDWNASAALVGAFPLSAPAGAAVNGQIPVDYSDVETFTPGTYSIRAEDNSWQGGTALLELYTGGTLIPLGLSLPVPQLPAGDIINFSLLFNAASGGTQQAIGFALSDATAVLIRAVGPSLASYGLPNAAFSPAIEVVSGSGRPITSLIAASGADWGPIFGSVGAFALPKGAGDFYRAGILPAGVYNLLVSDASGIGGQILAEVYLNPNLNLLPQ
jgi:hypothetical protein